MSDSRHVDSAFWRRKTQPYRLLGAYNISLYNQTKSMVTLAILLDYSNIIVTSIILACRRTFITVTTMIRRHRLLVLTSQTRNK